MKAVDILVSARDRFLANRANWTVGRLARKRSSADDGKCFCSIGGVLNAGGGFTAELKLVTDLIAEDYKTKDHDKANHLNMILFVNNGKKDVDQATGYIALLKESLAKHGFAAKPTITAISYLQAAAKTLGSDVVSFNDATSDQSERGYNNVLMMFNLAIKNARRRHANGQRYAAGPTKATSISYSF